MKTEEFVSNMELIGCKVNLVNPDYVRGFVIRPDGCSIGRATLYQGSLDHIKWYWKGYGELNSSDYIRCKWNYMVTTSKVLTEALWDEIVAVAEVNCNLAYEEKLRKRGILKPNKNRRKICKGDVRGYINFDCLAD